VDNDIKDDVLEYVFLENILLLIIKLSYDTKTIIMSSLAGSWSSSLELEV
jgi:hypothetical protein